MLVQPALPLKNGIPPRVARHCCHGKQGMAQYANFTDRRMAVHGGIKSFMYNMAHALNSANHKFITTE